MLRSALRRQAEEENRALDDISPKQSAELWDQAYFETQIRTPAEKLLWDAEKLFTELGELDGPSWLHPWLRSAIRIELIEAQSVVNPAEGYRLLQAIPEDIDKAEALVKYGANTSPIFTFRAKQLLKNQKINHRVTDSLAYSYEIVGRVGRDEESCRLAMNTWAELYDQEKERFKNGEENGHFHGRRVALSSIESQRNNLINGLVRLASIGYLPAVLPAKQLILAYPKSPDFVPAWEMSREKQAAVLEFIDHQSFMGQMDVIAPRDHSDPSLEESWKKYIETHKEGIITELKQDFRLIYAFEAFDTALRLRDAYGHNSEFAQAAISKHWEALRQPGIDIWAICPHGGKRYRLSQEEKDGAAGLACFFRAIKLRAIELSQDARVD